MNRHRLLTAVDLANGLAHRFHLASRLVGAASADTDLVFEAEDLQALGDMLADAGREVGRISRLISLGIKADNREAAGAE